jgi:hypothetical protein
MKEAASRAEKVVALETAELVKQQLKDLAANQEIDFPPLNFDWIASSKDQIDIIEASQPVWPIAENAVDDPIPERLEDDLQNLIQSASQPTNIIDIGKRCELRMEMRTDELDHDSDFEPSEVCIDKHK